MDKFLQDATTLLAANQTIAALLIGAITFVECLAFVGVIFPGTATMVAIGGLIGSNLVDPLLSTAAAIVGAVLGYWLSYRLGRWLGPAALHRRPLKRHRAIAARARLAFRRYGAVAITIARFYGPARALVPVAAGILNMRARLFHAANFGSALLWVGSLFAIGAVVEGSLDDIPVSASTQLLLFAVVTVAISTVMGMVVKKLIGVRSEQRAGRRDRDPRIG